MPSPTFILRLRLPLDAPTVWDRLWDLDRHTRFIPLTEAGGGPLQAGTRFAARTRVGPAGFTDTMVVREWDPPHRCVIDKVGTPLGGRIEVTLDPTADGTQLDWRQSYAVDGLPDPVAGLARPAVAAAYRRTLRRIITGG